MHQKIDINHHLITRCKAGDASAQFELYKLHSRYMFNVAYNLLQHTAEAEDVMQEGFLKAFQKIATFKGEVNFSTWLRSIVVNKCLDVLRVRKDWVEFSTQEYCLEETEELPFSEDEHTISKVKNGLSQLSDGYRTVLTLYLLEGYDHSEIATYLGVSEETVRSQYSRGKKKLALILKELNVAYK